MEEEVWVEVVGYPVYEITMGGRIRSREEILITRIGKKQVKKGRILHPHLDDWGYFRVNLRNRTTGTRKGERVHRLLALTFIPGYSPGMQVNHINGIKTDNRIENLEWVTGLQNMRHAHTLGLFPLRRGTNNSQCTLTDEQVMDIMRRRGKGERIRDIAAYYGVTDNNIGNIVNGWGWNHITGKTKRRSRIDQVRMGKRHPCSKLTPERVKEIVRYSAEGTRQSDIARKMGVSGPTISNILRGKIWSSITRIGLK